MLEVGGLSSVVPTILQRYLMLLQCSSDSTGKGGGAGLGDP